MTQTAKLNIKQEETKYRELCEKYWEFDSLDYSFKHTVKSLAEEHRVSTRSVTEIISVTSSITFFCEICGCEIKSYTNRSSIIFENLFFKNQCICKDCKRTGKLNRTTTNRDEMLSQLEIAIKNQDWKKLNSRELELLAILTKCKTKQEVMHKVFQGMKFDQNYSQTLWERINLLNEMGLIWVERTESKKIIDFHTSGKLKEELEKEYPQFYLEDIPLDSEKLQIMLQKIPLKITQSQPDYSGSFNVKREIVFKPNVDYCYGAWLNDDGTIFLKIEPAQKQNTDNDLNSKTK